MRERFIKAIDDYVAKDGRGLTEILRENGKTPSEINSGKSALFKVRKGMINLTPSVLKVFEFMMDEETFVACARSILHTNPSLRRSSEEWLEKVVGASKPTKAEKIRKEQTRREVLARAWEMGL